MKSVVMNPRAYDWEEDMGLNRPWSRTIAGLIEKIPYLQQLGITA